MEADLRKWLGYIERLGAQIRTATCSELAEHRDAAPPLQDEGRDIRREIQ